MAIMKKLKNGSHFVNIDHTENFQIIQITEPLNFGCPVFRVLTEMKYRSGTVNSKSFVGKILLRIK